MMIKSIYIENFMSIGSATIEFDDSNILSLCGYNDSGKSAIIRLIDIMFYNAYANEQVHYIKDGESSFRCIVSFKDGVEYERIKYTTGSSVFMLRKDDEVLFDNLLTQHRQIPRLHHIFLAHVLAQDGHARKI